MDALDVKGGLPEMSNMPRLTMIIKIELLMGNKAMEAQATPGT